MMKILHVSCSPRGQASESYRLSQKIIGFLLKREPTAILVNRVIGGGAISHIDESYATALGATQQSSAEISPEGSMSQSEQLIQELESSDFVVIGTPMHNFTVPSALKAWIDHIVRVRRTFNVTTEGKAGTLRDRPVFVAVSSGGRYSGQRARQPDFLTPYLRAILGTIGLRDLTFFSVEGSALGPDAVAEARTKTDQALQAYFSSSGGGETAHRTVALDAGARHRVPIDKTATACDFTRRPSGCLSIATLPIHPWRSTRSANSQTSTERAPEVQPGCFQRPSGPEYDRSTLAILNS